jgi:hypothetical protein
MSLVWSSDSSEENARRDDSVQAKAEPAGFFEISLEPMAWRGRAVWLDRLLSVPVVLDARRRIVQFLPKK